MTKLFVVMSFLLNISCAAKEIRPAFLIGLFPSGKWFSSEDLTASGPTGVLGDWKKLIPVASITDEGDPVILAEWKNKTYECRQYKNGQWQPLFHDISQPLKMLQQNQTGIQMEKLLQLPGQANSFAVLYFQDYTKCFDIVDSAYPASMSDSIRVKRVLRNSEGNASLLYVEDETDAGRHVLQVSSLGEAPEIQSEVQLRGGAQLFKTYLSGADDQLFVSEADKELIYYYFLTGKNWRETEQGMIRGEGINDVAGTFESRYIAFSSWNPESQNFPSTVFLADRVDPNVVKNIGFPISARCDWEAAGKTRVETGIVYAKQDLFFVWAIENKEWNTLVGMAKWTGTGWADVARKCLVGSRNIRIVTGRHGNAVVYFDPILACTININSKTGPAR